MTHPDINPYTLKIFFMHKPNVSKRGEIFKLPLAPRPTAVRIKGRGVHEVRLVGTQVAVELNFHNHIDEIYPWWTVTFDLADVPVRSYDTLTYYFDETEDGEYLPKVRLSHGPEDSLYDFIKVIPPQTSQRSQC